MSDHGDGESIHTEEGSLQASSTFPPEVMSSPFFADAMLDLDTAHDLAETPDAGGRQLRTVPVPPPGAADALFIPKEDSFLEDSYPNTDNPTRRRLKSNDKGKPNAFAPYHPDETVDTVVAEDEENANGDTPEKHKFTRITHLDNSTGGNTLRRMRLLWASLPKSRPTWPRDWAWAIAFCIVVPLALAGPLYFAKPKQLVWTHKPLSNATLGAWWVSAAAAVVTTRWMYARKWRNLDEDLSTRHERVAAHLVSFAAWSVVIYLLLALTIIIRLPKARWAAILPLAYTIRDVYLVRRWKQRRGGMRAAAAATLQSLHSSATQSAQATSGSTASFASRYAFFKALVAMALDILSQSLRRASFWRVLTLILLTQTLIIWLWRRALIGALDDESTWLLLLAALGGKWATGTMARLLSLIASGGVVNWFVEQQKQHPEDQEEGEEYGDVELSATGDSQVPEAYRTVGASVYESVLSMDDIDEEDDEEEFLQEMQQDTFSSYSQPQESLSTVQGLLTAGLSVSFGSVAMCGLLGGPAQFVWSQIRKVNLWQQGNEPIAETLLEKLWNGFLMSARSFVRNHSDLAMSHVAAYYKPYPRAARDVTRLVEEAGGEYLPTETVLLIVLALSLLKFVLFLILSVSGTGVA